MNTHRPPHMEPAYTGLQGLMTAFLRALGCTWRDFLMQMRVCRLSEQCVVPNPHLL